MSNFKAFIKLQQRSVQIEKLFWIAASIETDDFKSFIGELSIQQTTFKRLFPEIAQRYRSYKEENDYLQALVTFKKLGLIAEIFLPLNYSFTFNTENQPLNWFTTMGQGRIEYVYAETMDQLLVEIESAHAKVFKEYVKEAKKRKNKFK